MNNLTRSILDIPVFERLDQPQAERLADSAVVTRLPKNAVFYSEDKAARGMHVLLSGRIKLFKMSEDGKEQTIFIFGPGEPFCLCSVFSDGRLPANMSALEGSEILFIPPERFEALIAEDPTILMSMLKVMSRRLKEAMTMIDSLALRPVPARLAAYLLSQEEDGRVSLNITYRELAKIVGVTPEALSRVLRKMSDDGLVATDGPHIDILDESRLSALSDWAG